MKVKQPSSPHGSGCSSSVDFSNRLSKFLGSKFSRGAASSVWTQFRQNRSEDLVDGELVCVVFLLGVSVWQEPSEWILEGVGAKTDQSHRLE